jgi:hypothetical protein
MTRTLMLSLALLMYIPCEDQRPPATPPQATEPCGEVGPTAPYTPTPAYSGPRPALPSPAGYAPRAAKVGDAFTTWGLAHHLHSRVHAGELIGKRITVVGYVVKTNYDAAPKCAVHRTGVADGPGCRSPVPTFSIGDDKGSQEGAIEVMGWASNFAQVYTMIEGIRRAPPQTTVSLVDEFWGNPLPNPLPSVGAKVKVTGTYGITFTKTSGGAASNPKVGIVTAETVETLEPAQEKATLPGMR